MAGLALAQTPAPVKVAIINAQKAVADTQEIQKAQTALEAKYRPRQQSIETLQRELQAIQQQAAAPNLAPAREAELQATFTQKQKQQFAISDAKPNLASIITRRNLQR